MTDFESQILSLLKTLGCNDFQLISMNEKVKQANFVINGGSKRLLKIISKSNTLKLASFRKEVKVDHFLVEHKRAEFNWVKILDHGENDSFFWIFREYIDGDSLASGKNTSQFFFGYDQIEEKYFSKMPNYLKKIAQGLKSLEKLGHKDNNFVDNRYKISLHDYDLKSIADGIDKNIDIAVDFYDNNKQIAQSKIPSVGDLLPANIIIRSDNQLFFSDFEWFSFDWQMMDTAFLWLFLWRYTDYQKIWLNEFVHTDEDRLLFRLSIVRIIIGWYSTPFDPSKVADQDLIERRKKYKNHIWPKYLLAAAESFDSLINIKA